MNHAAYSPADVADARRGRPDGSLVGYAADHGWQFHERQLAGHFGGLNPLWVDYVFNTVRGELVPGRFGVLQHELREQRLGDDGQLGPGTYYGVRTVKWKGWKSLVGIERRGNEPFDRWSAWLPTTSAKVLVPEAALFPAVRVISAAFTAFTEPELVPGFRYRAAGALPDVVRDQFAAGIAPALASLRAEFVRVELKCGALGITVNGFVTESERLDQLLEVLGHVAATFTQLAAPLTQPAPFSTPLPPLGSAGRPAWFITFDNEFDRSGLDAITRAGAELGMEVTDPVQLHRQIPHLPIPGTSRGVLSGRLPGSEAHAHLSWHHQAHPGSSAYIRPAAVLPASPDAPRTPAGGLLVAETDFYVDVRGGLACCWARTNSIGELGARALAGAALATMRATGAAQV